MRLKRKLYLVAGVVCRNALSRPLLIAPTLIILSASCKQTYSDIYPDIYPDYIGVTVPESLSSLKFTMRDGSRCRVSTRRSADTLWYEVTSKGISYREFPVIVSQDPIDPYIAYRLIAPGYESWKELTIEQREIATYKTKTIWHSSPETKGCANCHSFANYDSNRMLLHIRGRDGGTLFVDGDHARLLNLSTLWPGKQGTYPAWHPEGRVVAFSSNQTHQWFFAFGEQPIEVFDTASELILLDTQTDSVTVFPESHRGNELQTFPSWSTDGETLYYCSAESVNDIQNNFRELHYRLMSIKVKDGTFVGEPETVYYPDSASVSFPRINGDWLMFTRSDYGTFPIWHNEADLWLLNIKTGEVFPAEELNSNRTESYHSWSSNGKWIVFSSRRDDGRYTRLYIAHFDGEGHFSKPFMLPQHSAKENIINDRSFNIPEFVRTPIDVDMESISKLLNNEN